MAQLVYIERFGPLGLSPLWLRRITDAVRTNGLRAICAVRPYRTRRSAQDGLRRCSFVVLHNEATARWQRDIWRSGQPPSGVTIAPASLGRSVRVGVRLARPLCANRAWRVRPWGRGGADNARHPVGLIRVAASSLNADSERVGSQPALSRCDPTIQLCATENGGTGPSGLFDSSALHRYW